MLNSKIFSAFLFIICLVQAMVVYKEVLKPVELTKLGESSINMTDSQEELVNQPPVLQARSAFENIKNRTLFSSERKLPEKKKPKKPIQRKRPAPNPGFELTGVYLSAQEKIALIKTPNQNKAEPVHLDETYKGWTLLDVTPDSIMLESQGNKLKLTISSQDKSQQNRTVQPIIPSQQSLAPPHPMDMMETIGP